MTFKKQSSSIGQDQFSPFEFGAAIMLAVAAFVILGNVLIRSRYGIDLTDEGFYLISMANPSSYTASVTQFGFVYHPLYKMAHGDVSIIRQANYLITFGLAWILCMAVLSRAFIRKVPTLANTALLLVLSAAIATTAFLVTSFELPQSPSYNTLAYQSILLGVIGMILVDATGSRSRLVGQILVGTSWWLAFMAKPTTAVTLGMVGLLYVLIAGKFSLRLLAVSVATAALLFLGTAWVIDGSVYTFIERLVKGIEVGRTLGGGNDLSSIFRWDNFPLSGSQLHLLFLTSAVIALVIFMSASGNRISKVVGVAIAILFAVASVAISLGIYPIQTVFERYYGLQILALPIGCLIAAIMMGGISSMRRGDLALAISLLLLPHAYAFGTGRPYWLNAEGAALFWILAGIVLLFSTKAKGAVWRISLPVSGAAVLMASLFIHASMEHPMRQTQPLRLNADIADIGQLGNQLVLSHDFAEYIQNLRQFAHTGGFKANTPIIDLTGHSPGAVYALNGKAPGAPWLLGGYKGSEAFAAASLDLVSCNEISQAWVITEPSGPGKLSDAILKRYGIDLKRDYQDLGSAQAPAAPFPTGYAQHLLKPRRSHDAARSACELQRRKHIL